MGITIQFPLKSGIQKEKQLQKQSFVHPQMVKFLVFQGFVLGYDFVTYLSLSLYKFLLPLASRAWEDMCNWNVSEQWRETKHSHKKISEDKAILLSLWLTLTSWYHSATPACNFKSKIYINMNGEGSDFVIKKNAKCVCSLTSSKSTQSWNHFQLCGHTS